MQKSTAVLLNSVKVKFNAVPFCDTYHIVASVSGYLLYHDFAGNTQPYRPYKNIYS